MGSLSGEPGVNVRGITCYSWRAPQLLEPMLIVRLFSSSLQLSEIPTTDITHRKLNTKPAFTLLVLNATARDEHCTAQLSTKPTLLTFPVTSVNMAQSPPDVHIPPGGTITVKLINPVTFGPSIIKRFMEPAVPGLDTFQEVPSLCFYLEHPSGRKLVWDLGIRKDYLNYAPMVSGYIPSTGYSFDVTKNVADILQDGGVPLNEIEAVIWRYVTGAMGPRRWVGSRQSANTSSHWHWDHIGDPSTFPPTTDLVVGPGFKDAMLPGAPTNPESPLLESDYA